MSAYRGEWRYEWMETRWKRRIAFLLAIVPEFAIGAVSAVVECWRDMVEELRDTWHHTWNALPATSVPNVLVATPEDTDHE